ncbi:P-II family nitrogen regulator [Methylogaea oryzae]|uniref:Nitrogen regulatory protein P-II n=1 Tax=Methylogaea oryzae TaxID=1295382 RepID=A0A8D5AL33_9GAMM|nr:P-II family nitrogen regulator [Methylogaea oryzae]BBL71716.1 nitrogen regulatory protein P-II [Methylogaea oryzae]
MKEIRAYIQPFMLGRVAQALMEIEHFPGMSVSDCEGFGRETRGAAQDFMPFIAKKRLEIFAADHQVEAIVATIMREAHSGRHGDGKVYVVEVKEGGRISSGERGAELA